MQHVAYSIRGSEEEAVRRGGENEYMVPAESSQIELPVS